MTMIVRIVLLFGFILPGAVAAQGLLAEIRRAQHITVGYSEGAAPLSFAAAGGPAGYSIDVCEKIVERVKADTGNPNLAVRYVAVPPEQVPRFVGSRAVQLMCGSVSDTAERRRTMAFSTPIFMSAVKLLVRSADGPKTLGELKGGTVAVLGRTTSEAVVTRLNGGPAGGGARVASADAALSQLRLRQADAWARDEILLMGAVARESDATNFRLLDEPLSVEPIAIAMPIDRDMQALVNEVIADLVRRGQLEEMHARWFMQPHAASPTGFKMRPSKALQDAWEKLR